MIEKYLKFPLCSLFSSIVHRCRGKKLNGTEKKKYSMDPSEPFGFPWNEAKT